MSRIFSRPFAALAALSITVALCAAAPPAAADGLGRLFFTPEQRARLERQRTLGALTIPGTGDPALRLDGVMRRSDGKRMAWINGVAQHGDGSGFQLDPVSRHPSGAVISIVGESSMPLRVGESFNRATRERTGGLAEGSIVIEGITR